MDDKELFQFYYDGYKEELRTRDAINGRIGLPIGVITLLIGALFYFVKNTPNHQETAVAVAYHVFVIAGLASIILAAAFVAAAHWGYTYKVLPALTQIDAYRLKLHDDRRQFPEEALDPELEFPRFLTDATAEAASVNRGLNVAKAAWLFRGTTSLLAALVFFAAATVTLYFLGGFRSAAEDNGQIIIVESTMADDKQETKPEATPAYTPPQRPPLENLREGSRDLERKIITEDTTKKSDS